MAAKVNRPLKSRFALVLWGLCACIAAWLLLRVNRVYREQQLLYYAGQGNTTHIRTLLDSGMSANMVCNEGIYNERTMPTLWNSVIVSWQSQHSGNSAVDQQQRKYTVSPLSIAADKGQTETARFLLERGASVNFSTAEGKTPLLLALDNNCRDTAAVLLKHGANPDAVDESGTTALGKVMRCRDGSRIEPTTEKIIPDTQRTTQAELLRLLLSKGAKVTDAALLTAAGIHDSAVLRELLVRGLNPNFHSRYHVQTQNSIPSNPYFKPHAVDETPLILAASYGNLAEVEELLKAGADVNAKGTGILLLDGSSSGPVTALQIATLKKHPGIVKVLLAAGAKP